MTILTFTEKIIKHLETVRCASDWQIANAIYDDCMHFPHKSNGARITNIRNACFKSKAIGHNLSDYYFLKEDD